MQYKLADRARHSPVPLAGRGANCKRCWPSNSRETSHPPSQPRGRNCNTSSTIFQTSRYKSLDIFRKLGCSIQRPGQIPTSEVTSHLRKFPPSLQFLLCPNHCVNGTVCLQLRVLHQQCSSTRIDTDNLTNKTHPAPWTRAVMLFLKCCPGSACCHTLLK